MKVGASLVSHKLLMKSAKRDAKQTPGDGYGAEQTSNSDNISHLVTRQTQETRKKKKTPYVPGCIDFHVMVEGFQHARHMALPRSRGDE